MDKKPLADIRKILEESIAKYKMVKGVYEALKNPVYGEDFLKPLLLSIEYEQREAINKRFIPINKELHVDHILPQAFGKNSDWDYVDKDAGNKYMDTLGNMALLYYKKNEEALNKGFKTKCNIYQGKNEDGTSNDSGATCFETTREIVDVYEKWDVDGIKDRYNIQLSRIESLLQINKDMIEPDSVL